MCVFARGAILLCAAVFVAWVLPKPAKAGTVREVAVVQEASTQTPKASTPLPLPPAWDTLRSAYDYNSRVMTVVKETNRESDPYLRLKITFPDPYGLLVTGILLRPKSEAPCPCVLLLHGSGGRKENMADRFGMELASRGIASLALDAALHGERKDQPQPIGELRGKLGAATRITIVDYRIALDYLSARPDMDRRRFGVLGYSMGSQMGAVLAAVDARIAATLLFVGGDPIRPMFLLSTPQNHREEIEAVSPSNYVGHISPRPLLMVNGKSDSNITADMTALMFDAAKDPKEIAWFEGGHGLNPEAIKYGLDWLGRKLQPRPDK